MKRSKALAVFAAAALCMAALALSLTGCASQESYEPPERTPVLNTPAIGKAGVLRVGVNTSNAPLAGKPASTSKIVGLDVDVAAALADHFGLKVEIVDVGTNVESALSDGTVDIVLGVDKSETSSAYWISEAYLPTAVALFALPTNNEVPADDSEPKIAAQMSSKSSWAVANEFDKGTLVTTEDLKSAFSKLQAGEVQYVAADAIIGTYAAHSAGYDVHIVALMQQPSGYAVGVLDTNSELKQAVSEALALLTTNGVIDVIEMKWLGTALKLADVPLTAGATASAAAADDGSDEGSGDEGSEEGGEGEGGEEGTDEGGDEGWVDDGSGWVDDGSGWVDDGSGWVDDGSGYDDGAGWVDDGTGGDDGTGYSDGGNTDDGSGDGGNADDGTGASDEGAVA